LAFGTKMQLCKMCRTGVKVVIFEGMQFPHLMSEWSMKTGIGKLVQQGTMMHDQSLNEVYIYHRYLVQKSASGCFDKQILLSIWAISTIA
jgi:hypothetical protein